MQMIALAIAGELFLRAHLPDINYLFFFFLPISYLFPSLATIGD